MLDSAALIATLRRRTRQAASAQLCQPQGRLIRVVGLTMEVGGLELPIGSACQVQLPGRAPLPAEVVGFDRGRLFLMPEGDLDGLRPGALVSPCLAGPVTSRLVPIGPGLLGRVVDGVGEPLDGMGPLTAVTRHPLHTAPFNPMDRAPITVPLDVGVRAINGLISVGRGQRIGLMAGSGVGKSVLLGMMARHTRADLVVVGLIGERGREVKEFITGILGPEGRARAVVVAAPADAPPLLRLHGAAYATRVAEHFRDQGLHVLLIMDSLTRYAMAAREIALAIGEPPATKGYPPSVFARLPRLVERAGNGADGGGSVTAFYTVLAEGDDQQDPISDAARAILDGHIVLSRQLADEGHFPAIDINASISRVMPDISTMQQLQTLREAKACLARLNQSRDLISLGAYQPGKDAALDRAITREPALAAFLRQRPDEYTSLAESQAWIHRILMEETS